MCNILQVRLQRLDDVRCGADLCEVWTKSLGIMSIAVLQKSSRWWCRRVTGSCLATIEFHADWCWRLAVHRQTDRQTQILPATPTTWQISNNGLVINHKNVYSKIYKNNEDKTVCVLFPFSLPLLLP